MDRRRTSWPIGLLLLGLLTTGCGTTVQVGGGEFVTVTGESGEVVGAAAPVDELGAPALDSTVVSGASRSGVASAGSTGSSSGAGSSVTTGASSQGGSTSSSGTTSTSGSSGQAAPATSTTAGTAPASNAPAPTQTTPGQPAAQQPDEASAPPAAGTVAASGPGWDEKFVYLGVTTQKDSQEVFASVGYDDVDPGDTEAHAKAVVDEVNAQGGILGRQIRLAFFDVALLETASDPNGVATQVCTYFTQDRPVIAVVNTVTLLDVPNFRACLAKGAVTLMSSSFEAMDDIAGQTLAPYFFQAAAVSWTALAPVMISSLQAQDYFGEWNVRGGTPAVTPTPVRIGILVDNTPIGPRVGDAIKAALKSAGYSDEDIDVYQYADRTQGQQSSVLYFAGNDVTHIIVTNVELLAFQNSATGQGYQPRYGISTFNAPFGLEGSSPAGQNNGALGVGWAPSLDVAEARNPGVTGPAQQACIDRMAAAGQTFRGKALAATLAFSMCDAILLLTQGVTAGGGFDGAAIRTGMIQVSPSYQTAYGFGRNALSASKLFVPGSVRGLQWDGACSCFQYATPEIAL